LGIITIYPYILTIGVTVISRKLTENDDVISTDIKHLNDTKEIVHSVSYREINQTKNCQDIKANWMLLTQSSYMCN
jgi:hypothetical protein